MTEIDYLGIEGEDHAPGSWDALVAEFVQLVRFIRSKVDANETPQYMVRVREMEGRLQQVEHFGEPDRLYFDEVWEVLENEPLADDAHVFTVFMMQSTDAGPVVMLPTAATFHEHRRAVRWIREHGEQEQQYVIHEVFQT